MRLVLVRLFLLFGFCVSVLTLSSALFIDSPNPTEVTDHKRSYLGFDRNIYPRDAALPVLRKTFAFTSYWLGPPPGEKTNTWHGKRELLRSQGFGFLVLYRGPESRELDRVKDPRQKGQD